MAKGLCGPCYHEANVVKRREYRQAWREKNRDITNEKARATHEQSKEKERASHLRRKFGLSIDDYRELLFLNNGRCHICNKKQSGKNLPVDHCHTTGRVRGLLCTPCNTALGLLGDDHKRLMKAAVYLADAEGDEVFVAAIANAFLSMDAPREKDRVNAV